MTKEEKKIISWLVAVATFVLLGIVFYHLLEILFNYQLALHHDKSGDLVKIIWKIAFNLLLLFSFPILGFLWFLIPAWFKGKILAG